MPEDPRDLIAEAAAVCEQCENFLEAAAESVRAIPKNRAEALEWIAVTEELEKQAEKNLELAYDEDRGRWYEIVAREEWEEAGNQARWAKDRLGSERLDTEYRKAVARQMAGLLREDSLKKLDDIASRSDDPEVREAVAEYKEDVARDTRYITNMFPAATEMQLAEVRKARAEAQEILDLLRNPPVD